MIQAELKGVIIVCPHCGTRYQLSAETIGGGRLVQCASCRQSWQAIVPGGTSFAQPDPLADDILFDADAEAELDASFEIEQRRATQGTGLTVVPPLEGDTRGSPTQTRQETDEAPTRHAEKALKRRRHAIRHSLPMSRMRRGARLGALLALAAIVGGGLAWRTDIVRQVPDLAGFYQVLGLGVNVIGLEFRNVRTLRALRDGVEVLSVDARIAGVSPRRVIVPPVIVGLIDERGQTVYEWSVTPAARDLEAGEAVDIHTSLSDPPAGAVAVRLTFTNGSARTDTDIEPSTDVSGTPE